VKKILAMADQDNSDTLGFTGDELQTICKLVKLSLHDRMLQLTLPKCRITKYIIYPRQMWNNRSHDDEEVITIFYI
jgi:hypothetical protein